MTLDNAVEAAGIATLPSGALIAHLSATTTLSISQRLVYCSVSTALGGDIVITLPDVGQAAGLWFYIRVETLNSKKVTVEDNGGDAGLGDITLNTNNEFVLLYCSGKEWIAPETVGYS